MEFAEKKLGEINNHYITYTKNVKAISHMGDV